MDCVPFFTIGSPNPGHGGTFATEAHAHAGTNSYPARPTITTDPH